MRQTRDIMGMPVSIEVADQDASQEYFDLVFNYFTHVDETFSTYKRGSEISRINRGEIGPEQYSDEMREVFALADETWRRTGGYFDIRRSDGVLEPSGLVKGWAIYNAAKLLFAQGCGNFLLDAGGDVQTCGIDSEGREWSVGIRSPFEQSEVVKVLYPHGLGIATSGTYIRGAHIYDPHTGLPAQSSVVSLTVVGPDVYEADRFATAAFAMGEKGIQFIERLEGFEGYMITTEGIATMTSGFETLTYAKDD